MTPESESCSNQVLESRTGAGDSSSLKLEQEAKHNNDWPGISPVSSLSPGAPEQSEQWSMVSVSPRSGDGKFSTEYSPIHAEGNMFDLSSPMKPPSVQSMTSPSGYDPDRIPSSIFSSGPTSPAEWSVASNESLFSIQMGNNSFSRDYAFLFGENKPEDWCNSPLHSNVSETKSNEYSNFLPPVLLETTSENDKKSVNIDTDDSLPRILSLPEVSVQGDKENVATNGYTGRLSVTASNLSDGRRLSSVEGGHSINAPRDSNESAGSCASFAFPLLVENGTSVRSCSQRTVSGTQANNKDNVKDQEEEEPPLPETQDHQTPEPAAAAKCTWFSCRMCWPGCCLKLCC